MKLGVSAFAWTSRLKPSHLHLLPELKKMGFSGFEIPMLDPSLLPSEEIKAAFEANGMECTVCALLPKEVNPISPEPEVRKAAIAHLKRCIEVSARMGSKLLGGPLFAPIGYLPGHRPTKDEWSWAVDAFQALAAPLAENDLTLSIEPVNRSETFFLRTAEEARHLCESIGNPRIGITIDTFHANIEELSIPNAIMDVRPYLRHVHLSENDRGPLGRGHIPFDAILSALRKIAYSGYLMIEGFGYDQSEIYGPGVLWAKQDVSPWAFASESVQFLDRLIR
jgi:D-psicose/D-tagatose/L-ribulose 3-epimerase